MTFSSYINPARDPKPILELYLYFSHGNLAPVLGHVGPRRVSSSCTTSVPGTAKVDFAAVGVADSSNPSLDRSAACAQHPCKHQHNKQIQAPPLYGRVTMTAWALPLSFAPSTCKPSELSASQCVLFRLYLAELSELTCKSPAHSTAIGPVVLMQGSFYNRGLHVSSRKTCSISSVDYQKSKIQVCVVKTVLTLAMNGQSWTVRAVNGWDWRCMLVIVCVSVCVMARGYQWW